MTFGNLSSMFSLILMYFVQYFFVVTLFCLAFYLLVSLVSPRHYDRYK